MDNQGRTCPQKELPAAAGQAVGKQGCSLQTLGPHQPFPWAIASSRRHAKGQDALQPSEEQGAYLGATRDQRSSPRNWRAAQTPAAPQRIPQYRRWARSKAPVPELLLQGCGVSSLLPFGWKDLGFPVCTVWEQLYRYNLAHAPLCLALGRS